MISDFLQQSLEGWKALAKDPSMLYEYMKERDVSGAFKRFFTPTDKTWDTFRGATSETWPRRQHIGGATTRAHGAKDLTIMDMTEERMIKELHEYANKEDKKLDELELAIKEERWPSGLQHGSYEGHDTSQHIAGATTGSWEPAAENLKKEHRRKLNRMRDRDTLGYGTKALKREFMLRQMAKEIVKSLKSRPKDEVLRQFPPGSYNIELEALQRALGSSNGYELDPFVMKPPPEGFQLLPIPPKPPHRSKRKRNK